MYFLHLGVKARCLPGVRTACWVNTGWIHQSIALAKLNDYLSHAPPQKPRISGFSIYNTSEWCFSRDLIGSSISGYQVLFTSWRFPEKKMAREPHFLVKYSSYLGTAIKLVLYILKQLFASVSVSSGGYLSRRSGSVNIHRYSPPLRRIIVNDHGAQKATTVYPPTLTCPKGDRKKKQ